MTRKYSLDEIDQMRLAVLDLAGGWRASLAVVEDRLRTYMLNGTDPEELVHAAKEHEVRRLELQAARDVNVSVLANRSNTNGSWV